MVASRPVLAVPRKGQWSGALADPLLAALVDLLLPQRDGLLERVDRLAEGCQSVGSVRGRNGDRDARLPDLDPPEAVADGDSAEVVPLAEPGGDLAHDVLRHLGVGLVL